MTIRTRLEQLRSAFEQSTKKYLECERKLWEEGSGFFDKKLIDDLARARTEYQKSESEYHHFLSEILTKKPNIDAEL